MAATTLAFNINNVAWVPMIGLGIALTTIVGQRLGKDCPHSAARATWTAFWLGQAYFSVLAALYVLTPDLFLLGHAAGTSPEEFDRLRDLTVVLLRFVAAYSLLDAINIVFVHAIKGAGDTRFILAVSSITSPMPVLAVWLGITHFDLGLIWCWIVLTAWVWGLALIYLLRFLQGRWREMRVIEPAIDRETPDARPDVEPLEVCTAETV